MALKSEDNQPETTVQQYYSLKDKLVLGLGVFFVVISAFAVVLQIYSNRQEYRVLTKALNQRDDLNAEWGRLLIEQQTFGATAQVGIRAESQLNMHSPLPYDVIMLAKPRS